MVHFIFTFADGESRRDFNSTFDAYVELINAYSVCGDKYFFGARLASSTKPEYIDILKAEVYCGQINPVKDYLEYAAVSGFDESQICEDIKAMYFMEVPKMLASWKQHMREYMKELEAFMLKHPIA